MFSISQKIRLTNEFYRDQDLSYFVYSLNDDKQKSIRKDVTGIVLEKIIYNDFEYDVQYRILIDDDQFQIDERYLRSA